MAHRHVYTLVPSEQTRSIVHDAKIAFQLQTMNSVSTPGDLFRAPHASGDTPPSGDTLGLRVSAEKMRMVFAGPWITFAVAMAAVVLIGIAMSYRPGGWTFGESRLVLSWSLVTTTGVLSRLCITLWLTSAKLSDKALVLAARRYAWNAVFAGATWGSASWMLLPADLLQQEGFLLVAMCMVMMTGVSGQAVHRAAVAAFSITLTGVFAAGLLRFGDLPHQLLALGYVPFCAMLILFARKQEAAVTGAIELSHENEGLLALRTLQEHAARQAQAAAEVAREHAEQANRAKITFMAATSHDLRQPMHALVQYVGHMRRICNDPQAQATLGKIEDSVAAMEDLLNAVLDFSKVSMGSIKPHVEVIDIDHLLASIDMQIRPFAEAKGLALVFESEGGCVQSDPVLLERIVRNIAQNAVRYTESGSITIRAASRGRIERILVSDSGIGIPQSERQRIFEPYYQVDNQARDRRKGLGLGLAIVRELADLLGVRIRLKTTSGHGSTFALDMRRADGSPMAKLVFPMVVSQDYVKGALIVLIDDDPMARDGITTTLKDFGCRVLAASSAGEALQALAGTEFTPQAIVADYRLEGGQTGLDAIAQVLANQRALFGDAFQLPALLISGDTSPDELQRVADGGFTMLHKPVGIELLHHELNALLARSRLATMPTQ